MCHIHLPPILLPLTEIHVCCILRERISPAKEARLAGGGNAALAQGTDEASGLRGEDSVLCSQVVLSETTSLSCGEKTVCVLGAIGYWIVSTMLRDPSLRSGVY